MNEYCSVVSWQGVTSSAIKKIVLWIIGFSTVRVGNSNAETTDNNASKKLLVILLIGTFTMLVSASMSYMSSRNAQLDFPVSAIRTDSDIVHKLTDIKTSADRGGREYTLLYVDDNTSNLDLMRQLILNRPELHFIATTDPEQGLHLALTYHPDIIVLDMDMHELRVKKLFMQLMSNPATTAVPIVAINADNLSTDKPGMENLKFKACCAQPLDEDEFHRAVDRASFGV